MLVLLACLAAYRVIGVTLLIWFERDDFVLYILVRVVYLWFILVSGFVWPHANPVLAFIDTSIWPRRLPTASLAGHTAPRMGRHGGAAFDSGGPVFYNRRPAHTLAATPVGSPQRHRGRG